MSSCIFSLLFYLWPVINRGSKQTDRQVLPPAIISVAKDTSRNAQRQQGLPGRVGIRGRQLETTSGKKRTKKISKCL